MATQAFPRRPRRRARAAVLLAGALLALGARTSAAATVPSPRFRSATFDVWERGPRDNPMLDPTGRVVELHVGKQTLQASTFAEGGRLLVTRVLVPAGSIVYDSKLRRWYQDFETAPNNPKALHESVRIWLRNDEPGTYDISYRRRDTTWASEVLVERPATSD